MVPGGGAMVVQMAMCGCDLVRLCRLVIRTSIIAVISQATHCSTEPSLELSKSGIW